MLRRLARRLLRRPPLPCMCTVHQQVIVLGSGTEDDPYITVPATPGD